MQTEKRQQLLTIVAIAAIAFFAGDRLVITPLTNAWKARQARIVELRAQVEQGKTLLEREQKVRAAWEEIRRGSLPRNTSAAEQLVFRAIDKWAQDTRVNIVAITPQWKHDSEEHMTLQCRVEALGNLASLSRFLYDLEKDPMALKLESIELGSRDKEGQALSLGLQVSGLLLTPGTK